MKLGLLTTIGTNIGDDFIREGLLRCIREIAPLDRLDLVRLNKHRPEEIYPRWHPLRVFDKKRFRPRWLSKPVRMVAERLLPPFGWSAFDDCDVLIQCGTPVFWRGCRSSEWAKTIWRDVFRRLAREGTPVLNLGAGSCYPLEKLPETLVGDTDEEFVRLMLGAARLTTVRDPLAAQLISSVGGVAPLLCCPALLAGQSQVACSSPTSKVVVNYMAGAGHSDWSQNIDARQWEAVMRTTVRHLEQSGWQPFFLAHNQQELALAAEIWPHLPRACACHVRHYFELARDAVFGVCNRLHASMALAGLGIPSVTVGTDSRLLMVRMTGQPAFFVKQVTAEQMVASVDHLRDHRDAESKRLLALHDVTLKEHLHHLRPFFEIGVQ
jgi:hypothetical protein